MNKQSKKCRLTSIQYNPDPLCFILKIDGIFVDESNNYRSEPRAIIEYGMNHSLYFDSIRLMMSDVIKKVSDTRELIGKIIIAHSYCDRYSKKNIIYSLLWI